MVETLWSPSSRTEGRKLHVRWWRNRQKVDVPSRGYLWLVHGIGEHAGRYDELATWMTGFGYDVLAADLPGHGLTKRDGGFEHGFALPDARAELEGVRAFWGSQGPMAAKGAAKAPWALFGHSMGGLIALDWVINGHAEDRPRRAYISAASLKLRLAVPAWKRQAAVTLKKWAPDFRIANGISPEDLSYDAANIGAYRTDPLVHGYATSRMFLSILKTADDVMKAAPSVEIPMCLAVGADDPLVDPAGLKQFYEALGTHKRYLEFPKMKHEIFNDIGRVRCYESLLEWLQQ